MSRKIRIASNEREIAACYPVMRELRPHLAPEEFLERVMLQAREGYRIAFVEADEEVVAVAGVRVAHTLAWGRFLYVDDLVTRAADRSRGHGAALLRWLRELACAEGCDELHLDSGTWRKDAHRFYEREGMEFSSHHYRWKLDSPSTS